MPCDLAPYPDDFGTLAASDATRVAYGTHIEVVVAGPGDQNRLLIFTGTALVNATPSNDDDVRRGVVKIRLDYPLPKTVQFIASATNASLASIANNDDDDQIYAVDCVSTDPAYIDQTQPQLGKELVLTAALAVQGGTEILRMAYQANVLLEVREPELDSLLVARASDDPPPQYETSATLDSGNQWLGRLTLTGPALNDLFVTLVSANPALVPVQDIPFLAGEMVKDFGPLNVGEPIDTVAVVVTATLKAISKTATLTLRPPAH
jgi:hypothetical protein